MSINDFWIILTACLIAIPCGVLGSFLVLRKMVMIGDAIAHAVLPGIVIAYLWSGGFNSLSMFAGAALTGVLTTFIIEYFHKKAGLQEDASIGVTFTWLFALGIILVSAFSRDTDLDQECILYGEIINVPFNLWVLESGVSMGPVSIWYLGILNFLVLLFVRIFYKELYITTFDPAYAQTIGIPVNTWHYVLMAMVALVTVAAFESVGAILVVAFLVIPAATAYLFTRSLVGLLLFSIIIGIISAISGYGLGVLIDASVAGSIVTMSGIFFIMALLLTMVFRNKKS